jgi:ABC-2 type transport system ATP-binding protein
MNSSPPSTLTTTNTPALECTHLTKSYGPKQVLRNLSLSLPQGAVIGLLGKNGSGKTTLLKAALGLIRPTSGSISTLGHDAWNLPPDIKARIGYVPQTITLYPWMKVRQILAYTASFYPRWNHALIDTLLHQWELPPDSRVGPLSAGQLQKLAILLAVGHEPDLLVLDEPAAALDPIARRDFLAALLTLNSAGSTPRTILFSTHITADLERVASHVAILKDGDILYFDELDTLKDTTKRLHITAQNPLPKSLNLPNTLTEQIDGPRARISLAYFTPALLETLQQDLNATIEVENLNLDDIFLELHHA